MTRSHRWTRAAVSVTVTAWMFSLALAPPCAAVVDFCTRTDIPGGLNSPEAVAHADLLDDDGDIDIAVTWSGSDTVAIYRNDGDGNFTSAYDLVAPMMMTDASEVGADPGDIVVLDLDGFPPLDIAGTNRGGTTFFAFLNDTIAQVGSHWDVADSEAERGNGFAMEATFWSNPPDANVDLVMAFNTGVIGIGLGNGDGTFASVSIFTRGDAVSLTDIAVDNFDVTEATLDVVTCDLTNQQLVTWLGDPATPGSILPDPGSPTGEALVTLTPTEVSGQGVSPFRVIGLQGTIGPNLLVGTVEGYVLFYPNSGNATVFGAPIVFDIAGGYSSDPMDRLPTTFTSMEYEDVTMDGIRDLVLADAGSANTSEGFNWLTIVPGTVDAAGGMVPDFDLSAQTHYAAADLEERRPAGLAVAEFDATPGLDIVLLNGGDRSFSFFRNDGMGNFDAPRSWSVGGRDPRGGALGRFDADATDDLVVALLGEETTASLPGGPLQLLSATRLMEPGETGAHAVSVASLNDQQDATDDVLATYGAHHVLWTGNGDGTFGAPQVLSIVGEHVLANAAGSASIDLAVSNRAQSRVTFWEGDGNGGFTEGMRFTGIPEIRDHAAGQFFTQGGRDDVIVSADETPGGFGNPGFWIIRYDGVGDTHLSPLFVSNASLDATYAMLRFAKMTVADLDGNSRPDLVCVTSSGFVVPIFNDGSSLFAAAGPPVYTAGGNVRSLLATDVTGDGIPDIVAATSDRVTVREGLGGGAFSMSLISLPTNISNDTVLASDLDGDALPELIVTSTKTNDVTVLCNRSTPAFRLAVDRTGAPPMADLSWGDQGAGATYDIMRGDLSMMWANRSTADAVCLQDDYLLTALNDADPVPPVPMGMFTGDFRGAFYYLARCAGGECSAPDFGTDSGGMPRNLPMSCPP